MTHEINLSVESTSANADFDVERVGGPISMNAEQVRVIYDSPYPEYKGATEVTPHVVGQILPTMNTLLKRDIEIKAIPYYETTNLKGGYTAIIGG